MIHDLWLIGAILAVALSGLPEHVGRAIGDHYIRRSERGEPHCHICGRVPWRCPYTEGGKAAARCPEGRNPP